MPRYIDAEKLAEHKFSYITHDRYVSDGRPKSEEEIYAYKVGYNDAIESIVQFAPTADVVSVVRCRECKHSTEELVKPYCNLHNTNVDNVYFCADGERREDE